MNIELDIAEESMDDIVCISLKQFIRNGYIEDKKLLKVLRAPGSLHSRHVETAM